MVAIAMLKHGWLLKLIWCAPRVNFNDQNISRRVGPYVV